MGVHLLEMGFQQPHRTATVRERCWNQIKRSKYEEDAEKERATDEHRSKPKNLSVYIRVYLWPKKDF
jgi:hypothetical protein